MSSQEAVNIAILDDYQGVALEMADWSPLQGRANVKVFRDHLADVQAIVQRLKPFEVVSIMRGRTPMTREILEQLPKLKLIAATGVRKVEIDFAATKELGVMVCGTENKIPPPSGTSELTWALILAIVRNLPQEINSVKQGKWQVTVGSELQGKTLGILGLGRIGSPVAKIAKAFGMNVIAWSQNLTRDKAEQLGASLVTKDELFRNSDVLSIHLVLSERTYGIIGSRELSLMKPTAFVVNTARGQLIDEKALIDALRSHAIAGYAVDSFDSEMLPQNHPFRTMDNVLATPHIGFVTKESYQVYFDETVENILKWLDGKPIRILDS